MSKPREFAPLPDPASIKLQDLESIPVSIVSGFLGSGKSTLINRWLRTPAIEGCAVIVNEFGQIGLDHLLVEHVSEDTVLLANGCLCCSLRSNLVDTLRRLYERRERSELPHYTRVIIETSGLADCAPIVQIFMTDPLRLSAYKLDGLWVTVDAQLGVKTLERHLLARRQVALADHLLLTKCDRVDSGMRDAVSARLASYSDAPVYEADSWAGFADNVASPACSIRVIEDEVHDESSHFHNHEQVCVHCWLPIPLALPALYAWARDLLDNYGDDILRIKGLIAVSCDERPHAFQCVQHIMDHARPLERWPGDKRQGWLEVITSASREAQVRVRLNHLHTH